VHRHRPSNHIASRDMHRSGHAHRGTSHTAVHSDSLSFRRGTGALMSTLAPFVCLCVLRALCASCFLLIDVCVEMRQRRCGDW
jgi:hypothetical protein